MATENTTPRLLAAAKEFNIGKETLVEFLTSKNFEVNASNPNTKLTEEMYFALQAEFAKDKLAKKKSDEIALPKSQGGDARKKAAVEPDAAVADKAKTKDEPKTEELAPVAEAAPAPVQEEVPAVPAPAPEKEEEAPAPAAPVVAEETPAETSETPEKAVKKDGPNILGKINLDELNQSTRPKKSAKKKEEEPREEPVKKTAAKQEEQPEAAPAPVAPPVAEVKPEVKEQTPEPAAPKEEPAAPVAEEKPESKLAAPAAPVAPVAEEPKTEHIEMKAPRLEGPKIIGKIELPVSNPADSRDSREKRNRKRIPVQKKPETFRPDQRQGNNTNNNGGARPGQSQGQNNNRPGQPGQGRNDRGGFDRNRQGGNDRRPQQGGGRNNPQQPAQEIDAKQIQKKLQETQNKLAGGMGGRNANKAQKAKYRRDKRELMAEKRAAAEHEDGQVIKVTEFISVSELRQPAER
ncbi:MAG: hypothetical protein QM743_12850 [Chitinophagaceae bacterium]